MFPFKTRATSSLSATTLTTVYGSEDKLALCGEVLKIVVKSKSLVGATPKGEIVNSVFNCDTETFERVHFAFKLAKLPELVLLKTFLPSLSAIESPLPVNWYPLKVNSLALSVGLLKS